MVTEWILRVGDGQNFINSTKDKTWGVKSKVSCVKSFLKNVKQGDRLWFVKRESRGKVIAVATYVSHGDRVLGLSKTNEELGWTGDDNWDIEIHYKDFYNLSECELLTHIKSPLTIRKWDEKCCVNLAIEYIYIVKYSKAILQL